MTQPPMTATSKVRIVWNGQGGELDSRTAEEGQAAAEALRNMLKGYYLNAGDSIEVRAVPA